MSLRVKGVCTVGSILCCLCVSCYGPRPGDDPEPPVPPLATVDFEEIPSAEPMQFPDDESFWDVQVVSWSAPVLELEPEIQLRQTINKMAELRISFDFEAGTRLGDAIQFVRDYSGLEITVDPAFDTHVALGDTRVSQVCLYEALTLLLSETGLVYDYRDGGLYLGKPETSDELHVSSVYDVSDILRRVRSFGPSHRDEDPSAASPFSFDDDEEVEETIDMETMRDLVIESTGGEETWSEWRSTVATSPGKLHVTAPLKFHIDVWLFLSCLRG